MIGKNVLLIIKAYLITALIIGLLGIMFGGNSIASAWHIIITLSYFAPINALYISVLFICKINTRINQNTEILIEICLLIVMAILVKSLIYKYVGDSRFEIYDIISSNGRVIARNVYGIKWQYSDNAQLCYAYILLFLIYIIRHLIRLKE